MRKFYISFTK